MAWRNRLEFQAIGTDWLIETDQALDEEMQRSIKALCETYDHTYSRFRDDSLVAQMSRRAGEYLFPDNAQKLFDFYDKLYRLSDGKVTPLIGAALSDLGYDAGYSLKPNATVHPVGAWEELVKRKGLVLVTEEPVLLDIGAAGKGYLADLIGMLLGRHDIYEYVIDASGDIIHKGDSSEKIGLEDPRQAGKVIGLIEVRNESVCGSASNRRAWRGLHHIIDPITYQPVSDIIATWVVAEDGLTADGLATSLFFVAPDKLDSFSFGYLVIYADGSVRYDKQHGWNIFT